MKKIIIYTGLLLAGLLLYPSCQRAGMDGPEPEESFRLKVDVEGINAGLTVETRSAVDIVEGEDRIANLRMFFFAYSNDGSGTFVQDYLVEQPAAGSQTDIKVGAGAGSKLRNSLDYSILAFANMDDFMDAAFLASLEGKTEAEVSEEFLRLNAAAPAKFSQSKLPMSGRCVKKAGQQLAELNLTRTVSRFDISNYASDEYELVSAAVYNAATISRIWDGGRMTADQVCTSGKYCEKKCQPSETAIAGGLYALENFVADPAAKSGATTSLVIGLRKKSGPGSSEPMFYRVPVHPSGEGQNLKRNHVYRVTVNAVLGSGAASEDEAVSGGIDASINNWNLDEEGLVVTDGDNILAIPSKVIRFGPAAASRQYDIYTHGEGTLVITEQQLPDWLDPRIEEGGKLKVAVAQLPDDKERRATVEIGFGNLRGRIEVIQNPDDDNYLILDPGALPEFEHSGDTDGKTVSVSASGPWQAKIYNLSGDVGFSFAPGGRPSLVCDSDNGDEFKVYVLGDNPKRDIVRGFIIASLVNHPEYKQVIMLSQESRLQIRISPDYSGFRFTVTGSPVDRPEDHFPIEVIPGKDKATGETRPWRAVLEGENAKYFELSSDPADPTRLKLRAKGTDDGHPGVNLTPDELSGVVVRIEHTDVAAPVEGMDCILLPVTQDKLELIVELVPCSLRKVPVEGAEREGVYQDYVEYKVTLDPRLKWKASIVQTYEADAKKPWLVHDGFFVDRSRKALKGQTDLPAVSTAGDDKIRIGFDKVYYPLINVTPAVEVTVSIEDHPFSTTITVEQERLLPRPVKIQSYNDGWASLGIGNSIEGPYVGDYGKYLASAHLFGTASASMVKTDTKITKGKGYIQNNSIESGVTYVQFNSQRDIDDRDVESIRKWHVANHRNLLVTAHEHATHSEKLKALLDSYAAKRGYSYKGDGNLGTSAERNGHMYEESFDAKKRAMLFILQDGPATRGTVIRDWKKISLTGSDAISSGLTEWPAYAVPILQFGDGSRPIPHMSVVIDPMDNLIFYGEMQHFDVTPDTPNKIPDTSWNSRGLFLANLTAYVVNASQYGSHFTDMFIQLAPGDKGYDANAEAERAQRYENAKMYWLDYTPETW